MTRAPDTSVVIAGLSTWHPDHATALDALRATTAGVGHVLVESYSVLSCLPQPRRVDPHTAWQAVRSAFSAAPLTLAAEAYEPLLAQLVSHNVVGGAVYDAIIAETARTHGVTLVSLDRRAMRTYQIVGAEVELLVP